MIASLPMYDWPEVREPTDAWWAGIARHLGADINLTRDADYAALWHRSDLLMSQTCGYPFTHDLKGRVTLVATPHYGLDGCDGPNYRSIVFARERKPLTAFRNARAAVNNPDSMSGMLALQLVFSPCAENGRFFGDVIESGGHVASMRAVRDGKADVCAIDAVCVALARRYRPDFVEGLVEIARSPMVPGLPYITTCGSLPRLRAAIAAAFADDSLQHVRDQLFLTGHSILGEPAYDRIIELEDAMKQRGGLKLL
jgi:ABC-type phosphate/phosphonate transport system substrate-binding protein